MSEEEIIKEFIEDYNASYPDEEEWVVIYPNQVQAIQGLLDLYNKEKEKHNKLINNILQLYNNKYSEYELTIALRKLLEGLDNG